MSLHNQHKNHVKRLFKATGYSIAGLKSTYQHEQAFRLEIYIFVIVTPLAIWLSQTALELVLLMGSWLFVMIVELINSAIEAIVDRIGVEKNELSGRAKDIGSAAVMVSVLLSLSIWIAVIFG
ncbi:MAG: diacylglycerol kinase (ATP) [Cellvibrionaceae bacterium]|jgi:diacylglycerol kinase (ATP)